MGGSIYEKKDLTFFDPKGEKVLIYFKKSLPDFLKRPPQPKTIVTIPPTYSQLEPDQKSQEYLS